MSTLRIEVSERALAWLREKAIAEGTTPEAIAAAEVEYASDEDEFSDVGEPDFRTREELEKLIEEGMQNPLPIKEMDAAFWTRLDARIRERSAHKKGPA